jgi:hypothetical protein
MRQRAIVQLLTGLTCCASLACGVGHVDTIVHDGTTDTGVQGQCGSAGVTPAASAPTSGLCAAGTASAVSGTGPWTWMCAGADGGDSATCAAQPMSAGPSNGACGVANGAATTVVPGAGLCAAGTPSAVSGSGPWSWSCKGIAGGSASTCAAPLGSTQTCSSVTYHAPSAAANDITFTFAHAYTCGQFANADWWVVTGDSGTVNITSISPAYASGRHGWDVNPDITGNVYQSWDDRAGYFVPPAHTLPYAAAADSSVIKMVSMADGNGTTFIQFGAVLTVLAAAPSSPSTTFRPPALGATKHLFSTTSLVTSALPSLPSACCADAITAQTALARSSGYRNNYDPDTVWGYYVIPDDAVQGQEWGGDVWVYDTDVLGWLMLDEPLATKLPVLVAYVQQGIDLWGAYEFAGADWSRGGGGNGAGALTTMVFAAAVLADADFRADVKAVSMDHFLEGISYYIGRNGVALYGSALPWEDVDSYWTDAAQGENSNGDQRDPYGYIDGGSWPGHGYDALLANSVSYTSVLLRAMPAFKNAWPTTNDNLTAIIGYGKRFASTHTLTLPDPCAAPTGTYGTSYGSSGTSSGGFPDCIHGGGRFPANNGANDTASRQSAFMDELYSYADPLYP